MIRSVCVCAKLLVLPPKTIQSLAVMPKFGCLTKKYKKMFLDVYVIMKSITGPILCKCKGHASNTVDFKSRYHSHED